MWSIIDAVGNLAGPLWPDWLDSWLDELADLTSSVPDIYDACGVGCVVTNYADHVMIVVYHYLAPEFVACLPQWWTC